MNGNFFDKTDYEEADILRLIELGAEEGLFLEFKQAEAIEDSREIAKDVCAMANSGGGIVIYGLAEKDHKADTVSYIDGNLYSKERLDQIIAANIKRRIPDLKIYPIRFEGKINQTVYIVKVPESPLTPHMTNGKYYKRYNFTTLSMEEYEVRNAYLKIKAPVLKVERPILEIVRQEKNGQPALAKMITTITNMGTQIERFFKLEISVPVGLYSKVSDYGESPMESFQSKISKEYVYSIVPSSEPIFQNETLRFPNAYLKMPHLATYEDWKGQKYSIRIKLYYTGGIIVEEFSLNEIWLGSVKV